MSADILDFQHERIVRRCMEIFRRHWDIDDRKARQAAELYLHSQSVRSLRCITGPPCVPFSDGRPEWPADTEPPAA